MPLSHLISPPGGSGNRVDLSIHRRSSRSVMIVVPVSPDRDSANPSVESYRIAGASADREQIYAQFVERSKPTLAEVVHHRSLGLRKLVVPTREGIAEGRYVSRFFVDPENYFFLRGASRSPHPFWASRAGAQGSDGDRWMQPDRGKNFILEIRKKLVAFCTFLPHNADLLDGFMEFLSLFPGERGLGSFTADTGFPPGLAEQILDHLYLGPPGKPPTFARIDWSWRGANGFGIAGLDENGNLFPGPELDEQGNPIPPEARRPLVEGTVARLVEEYRRALLDEMPTGSWTLKGASPFTRAIEQTAVASLGADFRKARVALRSIVQMLPCHVLPQESLAWLFDELFRAVCGTAEPTKAIQYNQIAAAINQGVRDKVKAPTNLALGIDDRRRMKQLVIANLETIVTALLNPGEPREALPEGLAGAIDAMRGDESVMNMLGQMVPREVEAGMRPVLQTGAVRLLTTLFLASVAPRMFNDPTFGRDDLRSLIKGYELACILIANAVAAGAALEETLAAIGVEAATDISATLRERGALDGAALGSFATGVVTKLLPAVAGSVGPAMADSVELWRTAQRALAGSDELSLGTLVSGLRALRPFATPGESNALDASPVRVDERMLREFARAMLAKNREFARLLRDIPGVRDGLVAAEGRVQAATAALEQVAVAVAEIEQSRTQAAEDPGRLAELDDRLRQTRAARQQHEAELTEARSESELLKIQEGQFRERWDRERQAEGRPGEGPGTHDGDDLTAKIHEFLVDLNLVQPLPDGGPAGDPFGPAATAQEPSASLLALEGEDDLDSAIERVLVKFRSTPANQDAIEGVLRALENLNHRVFAQYGAATGNARMVAFRRQVEAMVLGKIMLALHDQIGLGGNGSGLVRCLVDLTEKTGKAGDETIDGLEVLREVSLHDYLDGAYLRTGAGVKEVRDKLRDCARESFENIKDFVSELHGLRYLLHQAASETEVRVVNASAEEFRLWMDRQNLTPGRPTPFSVISDPSRNPNAGKIDRPGLLYLSDLAFAKGDRLAELGRWSEIRLSRNFLSYVVPPVILSAPAAREGEEVAWYEATEAWDAALRAGAPFPWLIAGPSHVLNARHDAEFPTTLPAAYPVLARFLGREEPDVSPDELGVAGSSGRMRRVGGFGTTVKADLVAALDASAPTTERLGLLQNFACDYWLYLVLALFGDLKAAGVSAAAFFDEFWDNPIRAGNWATLADLRINGVSMADCLVGRGPLRFRFPTNIAPLDGQAPHAVEEVGSTRPISDTHWFAIAKNQLMSP